MIREPTGRRVTVARTQLIEPADPALDVKDAHGNVLLNASDWDPKAWPLLQRLQEQRQRLLRMYHAHVISGDVCQEEIKLQIEVCTARIRALHPDLPSKALLAWLDTPREPPPKHSSR